MSDARRGLIALALVVGCGGSHAPPALTGNEIDLTAPGSSEVLPSFVPEPNPSAPASPSAVIEGEEFIDDTRVLRLAPASVPPLRPDTPTRGSKSAPVLIQIWSDFECPFCAQTVPLVSELERMFGARIRVAWRAFPLPGHRHARLAATAALSVFRERGPQAFWKAHDALFTTPEGLNRRSIESIVSSCGASVDKYRRALAERTFDARVDADIAAGDTIPIEGTPSLLVGRYYVFGVAPLSVYAELIERTLAEASAR